jgi:cytochrome b
MTAPGAPGVATGSVRAWGLAVRACHWGLAASVISAFVIDDGGPTHRWIGYLGVALVLVRWAAGFTGSPGARWSAMVPSWRATTSYVDALRRGAPPRHRGHDPLGLWMAWLLWALVLALALTGWMSRLDAFWGDEMLQAVHAWLADSLLAAVVVHLLGVAAMSWAWRENLPLAMVTGRKRPLDGDPNATVDNRHP